jgi:hypothetical protein
VINVEPVGEEYDLQLNPEHQSQEPISPGGTHNGQDREESSQPVMNFVGRPMPGLYSGDYGLEGDLGLCGLAYISGVSFPHTIFYIITN